MAWIESHQELGRHPKVRRLARVLDVPLPQAIGHLHLLWWWALDFADDGQLGRFDGTDIADAAGWTGDAGDFVSAMKDAGFLDADEAGEATAIHDWPEYAGRLLERRRQDAERKRKARGQAEDNPEMSGGRPADGVRNRTVPKPYPTAPEDSPNGAKGKSAPTGDETYLLEQLHRDPRWGPVTHGAIVSLNQTYGRGVVTVALQRAVEEARDGLEIHSSPYGLLEAMCKDVAS
jgi:hypothetical protein